MAGGEGLVLWITGLPSSGKSTLAAILARRLSERGCRVEILDADSLRTVLTPRPSYTEEERDWFYEVLGFLAELLARNGITVLVAATAHRRAYRDSARRRISRFAEVYLRCPIEVCRRRDVKGLYEKARQGVIRTLPGEQVPFESPEAPEAEVDTGTYSPEEAAQSVLDRLADSGLL